MVNVDMPDLTGAACVGEDPESFFPVDGDASREVYSICRSCPVRNACLEFAITHPCHGIWGGTNAKQRQKLAHARGLSHNTAKVVQVVPLTPQSLRRRELRAGAERMIPSPAERAARLEEARRLAAAGVSVTAIAGLLNVSRKAVAGYLREEMSA